MGITDLFGTDLPFDDLLPLFPDLLLEFRTGLGNGQEVLHPFKRTAGIDDGQRARFGLNLTWNVRILLILARKNLKLSLRILCM